MDVAFTPLCETPGWSIETLDPVPTIRRFGSPSISNKTVGEPCSSRTETVGLSTAFSCYRGGGSCLRSHPLLVSLVTRFLYASPFRWSRCFIAGRAGSRRTLFRISPSRRVSVSCSFILLGLSWQNALALHLSSALV
jgi:hypothetical protein